MSPAAGTHQAGQSPSGAGISTSSKTSPRAAGSGSNGPASIAAQLPGRGIDPPSTGRSIDFRRTAVTGPMTASPSGQRRPQTPGCAVSRVAASVTDRASAARTRSGYSVRSEVSSSSDE